MLDGWSHPVHQLFDCGRGEWLDFELVARECEADEVAGDQFGPQLGIGHTEFGRDTGIEYAGLPVTPAYSLLCCCTI